MNSEKIFVVEDDEALSRSLARSLTKRGYEVATYVSAMDFLADYSPRLCGCLVLDFGLPGMNGLELQAHLGSIGARLPIIFITGHGGVPESVQATKAGAIDFLEKPYKPSVLIERIETALELGRQWQSQAVEQAELRSNVAHLTEREAEIFRLILDTPDQASSKAIARSLDISPRTADIHRARILTKTGCASVAEMVLRYKGL